MPETQPPLAPKEYLHVRRLNELAGYSDAQFVGGFRSLLSKLPQFQPFVEPVLHVIESGTTPTGIKELTFIGIEHHAPQSPEDKAFGKEMKAIFAAISKSPTLFVSGEHDLRVFTKNALHNEKNLAYQNIQKFGIPLRGKLTTPKYVESWEEGFVELVKDTPQYSATGLDSHDMHTLALTIAAAMREKPQTPYSEIDDIYVHSIEGRTRYGLMRAANQAKPGQALVFIQGLIHGTGVAAWGKRNDIGVDFIIPDSLKPAAKRFLP